jgi:hypothetical protein
VQRQQIGASVIGGMRPSEDATVADGVLNVS